MGDTPVSQGLRHRAVRFPGRGYHAIAAGHQRKDELSTEVDEISRARPDDYSRRRTGHGFPRTRNWLAGALSRNERPKGFQADEQIKTERPILDIEQIIAKLHHG